MLYNNILLIDDDEDDQEIFLMALDELSENFKCTTISSARDALSQLENGQLSPDLILLDLNMPIMNGQQFLAEIKKKESLKHIPVIIFSTSFHEATIQLARELGAADFITKPGKIPDLVNILKPLIALKPS